MIEHRKLMVNHILKKIHKLKYSVRRGYWLKEETPADVPRPFMSLKRATICLNFFFQPTKCLFPPPHTYWNCTFNLNLVQKIKIAMTYSRTIPCQITETKLTLFFWHFLAIISKQKVKLGIWKTVSPVWTKNYHFMAIFTILWKIQLFQMRMLIVIVWMFF